MRAWVWVGAVVLVGAGVALVTSCLSPAAPQPVGAGSRADAVVVEFGRLGGDLKADHGMLQAVRQYAP